MPSSSTKQAKFMRAIAHSPAFAKKVGVKQSVGKDFEMADKKTKKFGSGGQSYPIRIDLDKAKRDTAARDQDATIRAAAARRTDAEKKAMKAKYPFNNYASGGVTKAIPSVKQMGDLNMAKGGMAKKAGKAMVRMDADTEGRAMVKLSTKKSINGVARKGKTATTRVKMKGSK